MISDIKIDDEEMEKNEEKIEEISSSKSMNFIFYFSRK